MFQKSSLSSFLTACNLIIMQFSIDIIVLYRNVSTESKNSQPVACLCRLTVFHAVNYFVRRLYQAFFASIKAFAS